MPKSIVLALLFEDEKDVAVSVCVLKVNVPVVKVNDPENVGLPDSDKLMSDLLTVQLEHTAVAVTVTVAATPEFASNVAVSALVGAEAPDAPPVVADQFAVLELSQVPEPPTQNLAAIEFSLNCRY